MRAALLALVAAVGLAGACRRAPLHEEKNGTGFPDAGGLAGTGADAGSAGGAGGQGATGAGGTFDAGVADHVVDEPGTDGFSIGPIRDTCPVAPPSHACPTDRPASGGGCSVLRAICEYGGADFLCRDRWRCADDGTWQLMTPGCADRCPATLPADGSACDVAAWCSYPAQVMCICVPTRGWSCKSAPDPECPELAPLHGSGCDLGRERCSYGHCEGVAAMCCEGSWNTGQAPCAE